MLVLTRYEGESICIGDNIEVRVLRFTRKQGKTIVHIGIDAPKEIAILRDDIIKRDQINGGK